MRLMNSEVESILQVTDYTLREEVREHYAGADGAMTYRVIHDAVKLKIHALPPDYDDSVENELPSPQPDRLGVEKDQHGKVMLDASNRPIQRYKDQDPAYLKLVSRNGKAQAIKMLVDGLEPGQINWDAVLDPTDAPAYYKAILAELKAFGFTMGDLLGRVKAIGSLSGIGDEDLKVAEADFSQPED